MKCGDCRHWTLPDPIPESERIALGLGLCVQGACGRIGVSPFDHQFDDDFAQIGTSDDGGAYLATREDFGCVLFEPKR